MGIAGKSGWRLRAGYGTPRRLQCIQVQESAVKRGEAQEISLTKYNRKRGACVSSGYLPAGLAGKKYLIDSVY